jgi:hypothetical protein
MQRKSGRLGGLAGSVVEYVMLYTTKYICKQLGAGDEVCCKGVL